MKSNKTTLSLLAVFTLSSLLNAQNWTEIHGVIPDASTAEWVNSYKGSSGSGTANENLVSALQSTPKDGKWHSYLSTGGKGSPNVTYKDGTVDTSKILSICGYDDSGWSGKSVWMQHYTVFDLPKEAQEATAFRISFTMDFLGTNESVKNLLDINVLPWNVVDQEIELRSAKPGQENKSKFLFGLVNLTTGEFIDGSLSNGDSAIFDYDQNNWLWTADENGTITASFTLDSSILANSQDGFALVIESTWGGSKSGTAEYYAIGDFKTEMLQIPEPSACAILFGTIALALVFFRKKK